MHFDCENESEESLETNDRFRGVCRAVNSIFYSESEGRLRNPGDIVHQSHITLDSLARRLSDIAPDELLNNFVYIYRENVPTRYHPYLGKLDSGNPEPDHPRYGPFFVRDFLKILADVALNQPRSTDGAASGVLDDVREIVREADELLIGRITGLTVQGTDQARVEFLTAILSRGYYVTKRTKGYIDIRTDDLLPDKPRIFRQVLRQAGVEAEIRASSVSEGSDVLRCEITSLARMLSQMWPIEATHIEEMLRHQRPPFQDRGLG